MQALRMLLRTWRGGQLNLIIWSLVLAVAVVTSVSLLAERIERALTAQSSSFLAADLVVRSSKPIDPQWITEALEQQVESAQVLTFASMVYHQDDMHLASIKAVEASYPLRGLLRRTTTPFTTDASLIEEIDYGPVQGEVWVDARLLPLLNIELGDEIELGEIRLTATQIVIEEPDSGGSFGAFGARVLMNYSDIEAAGIIIPGSRVTYRYLMAEGASGADGFARYSDWVQDQLDVHDRLITPDEAQASIADTMDKGRRFLLLAGSIGVVLAGIALALASHHFAAGQTRQVALLKSWGIAASRVRSLIAEWIDASGNKESRTEDSDLGGTMRLGSQVCHLLPGSMAHGIYGADQVEERHRHRFEVNNNYLPALKDAGLVIGGLSHDKTLVETIELPNHPWFFASQFHPEFNSTPRDGHPLFEGFVNAALDFQKQSSSQEAK